MPLNPVDKMESPKTFQYNEEQAVDWQLLLDHTPRKIPYSGKVDPKGGLVDIVLRKGVMMDPQVQLIQFRPRDPEDTTEYRPLVPKVYDGEQWVTVRDYVQKKTYDWCKAQPILSDHVAGHMPDVAPETKHHGRFPPNAYEVNMIGYDDSQPFHIFRFDQ